MKSSPLPILAALALLAFAAPSASASPGFAVLTIAQRENVDAAGHYTLPVGFTPIITGPLLVCAYTYNEVGFTLAQASVTVNVQPPGAANARAPRVKRSGKRLVCRPGRAGRVGWVVDGKTKPGAHHRKLRVTRAPRGHDLACTVTSGGVTTTSRPIALRR